MYGVIFVKKVDGENKISFLTVDSYPLNVIKYRITEYLSTGILEDDMLIICATQEEYVEFLERYEYKVKREDLIDMDPDQQIEFIINRLDDWDANSFAEFVEFIDDKTLREVLQDIIMNSSMDTDLVIKIIEDYCRVRDVREFMDDYMNRDQINRVALNVWGHGEEIG